jgi:hypothetical protein
MSSNAAVKRMQAAIAKAREATGEPPAPKKVEVFCRASGKRRKGGRKKKVDPATDSV